MKNIKEDIVILNDMKIILVGVNEGKADMTDLEKIEKLRGREWGELFYNVLNCPKADNYLENDNFEIYTKRNELLFKKAIPNFPLLAELNDIYGRVLFSLEQVRELKKEVYKIMSKDNSNKLALIGLEKIIDSCEQAENKNKFLYFNGA